MAAQLHSEGSTTSCPDMSRSRWQNKGLSAIGLGMTVVPDVWQCTGFKG